MIIYCAIDLETLLVWPHAVPFKHLKPAQLTVSCGSMVSIVKSRPETTRVRYAGLNLQGTNFIIIRVRREKPYF